MSFYLSFGPVFFEAFRGSGGCLCQVRGAQSDDFGVGGLSEDTALVEKFSECGVVLGMLNSV